MFSLSNFLSFDVCPFILLLMLASFYCLYDANQFQKATINLATLKSQVGDMLYELNMKIYHYQLNKMD